MTGRHHWLPSYPTLTTPEAAMSAPTDTEPSHLEPPLDLVPLEDEPVHARVRDLVAGGLPRPLWAGSGRGTAVLRAVGPHPLDDLLAWAGEMAGEPHWWLVRFGDGVLDVHAAGMVHGLAVSIAAATGEPIPTRVTTADVMAAAAVERHRPTGTAR